MSQAVEPSLAHDSHADLQPEARAWFEALRDRLCAAFEAIEDEGGPDAGLAAGRFERTPWRRPTPDGVDGGGGVISLMRGRVFEKVGVNVSTVAGEFSPEFRKQIPGAEEDPRFFATGISLVAHMRSPRVPAAHFNTRFLVTTKHWFGGGGDMTPMRLDAPEAVEDAATFHAGFRAACDAHDPEYYPKFKAWCDRYFFLRHRNEMRGVGGIFFDDFNESGFDAGFATMRSVGDAFFDAYPPILQRRKDTPFTDQERHWQALRRGRDVALGDDLVGDFVHQPGRAEREMRRQRA